MPSLPCDNEVIGSDLDLYRRYFGRWKKQTPPRARLLFGKFLAIVIAAGLALGIVFYILGALYYDDYDNYVSSHLYYAHNLDFPISCSLFIWSLLLMFFSVNNSNIRFTLSIGFLSHLFFYIISCVLAALYYDAEDKDDSIWNSSLDESEFCDIFDCSQWNGFSLFSYVLMLPLSLLFAPLIMYYSFFHCCKSLNKFDKAIEWQDPFVQLNPNEVQLSENDPGKYKAPDIGDESGALELVDTEEADDDGKLKVKQSADYDDGSAPPPKKSSVNVPEDGDEAVMLGDGAYAVEDELSRVDSSNVMKYSLTQLTQDDFRDTTRKISHSHMTIYSLLLLFILFVWYIILTLDPNSDKLFEYHKLFIYLSLLVLYHVGKYTLKRIARRVDRARTVGMIPFEIATEILMSSFYYFNFRKFLILFDMTSTFVIVIVFASHIGIEIFESLIRPSELWFNWTPGLELFKNQEKKSNIIQWKVRSAIDTGIRFTISVFSGVCYGIIYVLSAYPDTDADAVDRSVIYNYGSLGVECVLFGSILFTYCASGNIRGSKRDLNNAEPLMRLYVVHGKYFILLFVSACVTMLSLDTH